MSDCIKWICFIGVFVLASCGHHDNRRVRVNNLKADALGDSAFAVMAVTPGNGLELWRIGSGASTTWRVKLPCDAEHGLAADDELVGIRCVVITERGRNDRLVTFDARDGRQLWTHDEPMGEHEPSGQCRLTRGGFFLTSGERATILDRTSGKVRLVYPIASTSGPYIEGDYFALVGDTTVFIDPVTATGTTGPATRGCVEHGEYVDLKSGVLATRPISTPLEEPHLQQLNLRQGALLSLIACGTREQERVIEARVAVDNRTSVHVLRIANDGSVAADIDLGASDAASTGTSIEFPEVAMLNGELPRFDIVAVRDGTASHLMMIDLELGTVVWRGADQRVATMSVFRSGKDWFIADGKTLTIYDGASGTKVGAIQTSASVGVATVGPADIGHDRIWLHGNEISSGFPQLGLLDRQLRPLHLAGITVEPLKPMANENTQP